MKPSELLKLWNIANKVDERKSSSTSYQSPVETTAEDEQQTSETIAAKDHRSSKTLTSGSTETENILANEAAKTNQQTLGDCPIWIVW